MSTLEMLPLLRIQFDGSGVPTFTLDEDEYVPPGGPYPPERASIRDILEAIRADLGPIRVKIVETDGSTYSDILLAGDADSTSAATTDTNAYASGFLPGELVAVAVILSEHPASEDGTSNIRLPAAVLARHGSSLMLLGRSSGTLTFLGTKQ
ncbi:hypothetical protein ACFVJS_00600 [Nocardioides sp. NPDC057772]|uniref:hypothetical protein n=1 Tax=Nocardioides sp. NPDC057772 TaxID=3346245 RepID=UPI00366EA8CB